MKNLIVIVVSLILCGTSMGQDSVDSLNVIKSREEANNEYKRLILKADDCYLKFDYKLAKEAYQCASAIRPSENYPLTQLDLITSIQKAEAKILVKKQYDKLVTAADKNFQEGNYENALMYYTRASGMDPSDDYVRMRKIKAEELIKEKDSK